ncbi:MAG: hypothetical protein WC945_09145 [Bacteroidales bacterium]
MILCQQVTGWETLVFSYAYINSLSLVGLAEALLGITGHLIVSQTTACKTYILPRTNLGQRFNRDKVNGYTVRCVKD